MVVGEDGGSSQDTVHWPQGRQASLMRDPAVRESLGDTAPAQPFSGQCALITGGTSGIGLESAAQLGEAGVSRVAINGRSAARGAEALTVLRRRCPQTEFVFLPGDIADWTTAQRIAAAVVDAFGRIDIFVGATSPTHAPQLFHETQAEDIKPILNGLLLPPLHMTRAVLPAMRARKAGNIVLVASDAAKVATPGETVIGAAMAGIVMFVRTLAIEAKRDGIRVNALTPSIVADTLTHDFVMSAPFSGKLFAKAKTLAHLGVTLPADQASLVVFLAGAGAARLTGQAISANGGISAA
jgi:2-hydroxycyclohexanecarboxyl-CoA dehydrogenase